MSKPSLLIAGIGNIFLGDDAFGVEVVNRLKKHKLPESVRVVDFGIRGLDLAYALMDKYDAVILIDATQRGGEPGSLYVFAPDLDDLEQNDREALTVEAHGMVPERVLQWVKANQAAIPHVQILGCEPAIIGGDDEMTVGFSPPVLQAIPHAVEIVLSLIEQILGNQTSQRIPA
jgi:hydrogenase maturation protease